MDIAQDFAPPSDRDHKKSLPVAGELKAQWRALFATDFALPQLAGSFDPGGVVIGGRGLPPGSDLSTHLRAQSVATQQT